MSEDCVCGHSAAAHRSDSGSGRYPCHPCEVGDDVKHCGCQNYETKAPAPAPKPSHRERAEKFSERHLWCGTAGDISMLAAAFAEVEAEARASGDCNRCHGLAVDEPKAEGSGWHVTGPNGIRVPVPPLKPFQRVQSFKLADLATCTCGATSVGSRLHSDYCDSYRA